MGAAAFLENRSIAINPGEEAVASIRVRNIGSVVDQFTLGVLGDAQPWSTVEPPTMSLFPGAEGTATIHFKPPRSADVPAGPMPFGVRVEPKEDPAGAVVEEGSLEIGAFTDTFAELAPRTSRGSRSAAHDLAVDNRGNVRLNAQVAASDPDKALDFDINPPGVVADPGMASIAQVRVRPRKRFWRGKPQTHPFHVEIVSPGAPALGVDGTMLQEQILPSWTVRAIVLALVLAIAAVAVWFMLLQPAISSLARQELIAAGATVGPSGLPVLPGSQRQNAGEGSNGESPTPTTPSGGGSPGPTATGGSGASNSPGTSGPAPSATAPSNVGPNGQRDGRLQAGSDQVVVDQGVTLYVTDLIFSNPSETLTGQLILGRRNLLETPQPTDSTLVTLQLESFRNIDYHFVTPLLIPGGQALFLSCPGPGGCPDVSVLWSGFQR